MDNSRSPSHCCSRQWWTRSRVHAALLRFANEFKCTPSSFEAYAELQLAANIQYAGRVTTRGQDNLYPSAASIGKFYKYLNEAWRAVGIDVTDHQSEWTIAEDGFIGEALGILTREEIAECLANGRTAGAVKSRVKSLGWDIYTHHGITTNRAAAYLEVGQAVVEKYLKNGTVPYLEGSRYHYLNPADLLLIKEFDWTGAINPELEKLVRAAQVARLCRILRREDYRQTEIYRFHTKNGAKAPKTRTASLREWVALPPKPVNLENGDWVRVRAATGEICRRQGIVKSVQYSPQIKRRGDGTRRKCWMAIIEFPKYTAICEAGKPKPRRVRLCLPLEGLIPCAAFPKPVREVKSKEVIRKRKYSAVSAKRLRRRREIVERLARG